MNQRKIGKEKEAAGIKNARGKMREREREREKERERERERGGVRDRQRESVCVSMRDIKNSGDIKEKK